MRGAPDKARCARLFRNTPGNIYSSLRLKFVFAWSKNESRRKRFRFKLQKHLDHATTRIFGISDDVLFQFCYTFWVVCPTRRAMLHAQPKLVVSSTASDEKFIIPERQAPRSIPSARSSCLQHRVNHPQRLKHFQGRRKLSFVFVSPCLPNRTSIVQVTSLLMKSIVVSLSLLPA